MNALAKIVDLLTVISILFLLPLLYYGGIHRVSEAVMAGQTGKTFLKRISTAGEITLPVWKELEDSLKRYGCTEFEIQRERSLYERDNATGDVKEQTYYLDKVTIRKLVTKKGQCPLLKGDRMRLVLYINHIPVVYYTSVRTGATGE